MTELVAKVVCGYCQAEAGRGVDIKHKPWCPTEKSKKK